MIHIDEEWYKERESHHDTEKVSIKQETVSERRAKRAEKGYTSQQTDGEKSREVKNRLKMNERWLERKERVRENTGIITQTGFSRMRDLTFNPSTLPSL